jgi:hypothetical protein
MYSLDCGVAGGDLTADVHAYLTLFDTDLVGWYDSLSNRDFFPRFRAESRQRYAGWRSTASFEDRAALTWIGLSEVPALIKDSARHTLSSAIKLCGPTLQQVLGRLSDDLFIATHATPFVPSFHEIVMRARDDIRMMGSSDFAECRSLLPDMYERIRIRRNQQPQDMLGRKNVAGLAEPRRIRKARRRPLVKASELLSRIAGRETASSFIGGDDVIVTGKLFNFRVRKGVLGSNGHGAMNLTVTDKDNIELVDLCFYFEDMPGPDQLAALILHVQAGNEDQILKTANTIRTYDAGRTNSALLAIKEQKKRRNDLVDGIGPTGVGTGRPMANHLDRVLYNGIWGASDFYHEHHDELVPMLEQAIIRLTVGSRSGDFLQNFVPEALGLFETMIPNNLAIGRAIAEEPLMDTVRFW